MTEQLMEGCDIVVHCADRAHITREMSANPVAAATAANIDLTVRMAKAAKDARASRFVFLSSAGISVPSRSYTFMTAGRPILAMVHPLSEAGRPVTKEEIGWLVQEPSSQALAAAIAAAADSPEAMRPMGARARRAAKARYAIEHSAAALRAALERLDE